MKKNLADVVVVGGGAWGASCAYHLAAAGADVVIVDRHAANSQNSPRAAGMTMQARESDVMTLLAMRSVSKLEAFSQEVEQDFQFSQSGSLKLARDEQSLASLDDQLSRAQRLGLGAEMVSPERAAELAPYVDFRRARGILYTPSDVNLNAAGLTSAFLKEATGMGARVWPNNPVLDIATNGGRIVSVETRQASISCDTVVDAAGAWSPVVAGMVGVRLPVVPARHQLYVTEPIDGVEDSQPGVHIVDAQVYVRPDRNGLLFGGYEVDPLLVPSDALGEEFDMAELELDLGTVESLYQLVRAELPILDGAPINEHRGGLPTLTPDGHFILDADVGVEGFVVATGCCVSGLARSPAVGEVVASLVAKTEPFTDVSGLALSRFAQDWTASELAEACSLAYSHRYN